MSTPNFSKKKKSSKTTVFTAWEFELNLSGRRAFEKKRLSDRQTVRQTDGKTFFRRKKERRKERKKERKKERASTYIIICKNEQIKYLLQYSK